MDQVLRIIPGDITFVIRPGELCRVTCQYMNLHTAPISYNVRTTKPDLYCVRLNKDIIQPGETKDVIFIRRAFDSVPTELRCRDRFQVLVCILNEDELSSGATVEEVWAGRKQYQFERKFQVKFSVDLEAEAASLNLPADTQNGLSLQAAQFPSAAPALPSLPSALLPSSESVAIQENPSLPPRTPGVPPLPSESDLVPRTATGTVLPAGESFMAVSGLTSAQTLATSSSDATTISPPLVPRPGLRADAPPPLPFSAPPLPARPSSMKQGTPPFSAHPAFADQKTPAFPSATELPRLDSDKEVADHQHLRAAFDVRDTPPIPPRSISVTKKVTPKSSPPSASPEKRVAPPPPPPPQLPPRVDSAVLLSPPLPSRVPSGSDEESPVSRKVDRLARVEPEVESAAVTAAAATARIRTGEQARLVEHLTDQNLRKSRAHEVGRVESSETLERRRLDAEKVAAEKAILSGNTSSTSHSLSADRTSTATGDSNGRPGDEQNSNVNEAEGDDDFGYAQAEAVTVYTPTAEEEDRRRELNERKRVAEEEEKRRVEEERLRAEKAARARAEEIARIARETELERVRTRRQVETAQAAPRPTFAPLEGARAQRAAVDRACALHRMIQEREREIAKLTQELVEARHMRSNARIGVAPMYDTIYESDVTPGISFSQVAIMAALSGALLTLFL